MIKVMKRWAGESVVKTGNWNTIKKIAAVVSAKVGERAMVVRKAQS